MGGFEAENVLREYFSVFGELERVLVVHSRVLSKCGNFVRRIRPASLGLLVMKDPRAVQAIHATGSERTICGINVVVGRFFRPECASGSEQCGSSGSDIASTADDSAMGEMESESGADEQ